MRPFVRRPAARNQSPYPPMSVLIAQSRAHIGAACRAASNCPESVAAIFLGQYIWIGNADRALPISSIQCAQGSAKDRKPKTLAQGSHSLERWRNRQTSQALVGLCCETECGDAPEL